MTERRRERAWSGELRWTVPHTAAAAWTAGGLLMAVLDPWLWDTLWVVTMALWLLYAILGGAVMLACLWAGAWRGFTRSRVTAAIAMIIGALLVSQTSGEIRRAAHGWRFQARFRRMAPRYERIVKELATEPKVPERGSSGGVNFDVDAGPPRRIAFPQPGGIIDNWEGVIYDPSGGLERAIPPRDRVPGGFSLPDDLVGIFGGTLLSCTAVRDRFYRCWFT